MNIWGVSVSISPPAKKKNRSKKKFQQSSWTETRHSHEVLLLDEILTKKKYRVGRRLPRATNTKRPDGRRGENGIVGKVSLRVQSEHNRKWRVGSFKGRSWGALFFFLYHNPSSKRETEMYFLLKVCSMEREE